MAIRKFLVLSLVAAGATWGGFAMPATAQGIVGAGPVPIGMPADGGMLANDEVPLAPGETIIAGPPELLHKRGAPVPTSTNYGVLDPGAGMPCTNECYTGCDPGYFGIAEALFMQRRGDTGFTRTTVGALDEFDYEWGTRLTLGRSFDCVNGYEFVFTGALDWRDEARSAVGAPGTLFTTVDANLLAASGNFAQFNNTNILQVRRADYNSIEFNRTYNGWDVVRASLGLRTILYNEQYDLLAAAGGRASQSVENVLIGPQIGLDIYYPLSNRLFTGARFKGGVYLDIASSTSTFGDTNFNQRRTAEDEEISGVFEVGSKLGYQVTSDITATIGYDMWYMAGVAATTEQIPFALTSTTGTAIDVDSGIFIHGLTAGIEIAF